MVRRPNVGLASHEIPDPDRAERRTLSSRTVRLRFRPIGSDTVTCRVPKGYGTFNGASVPRFLWLDVDAVAVPEIDDDDVQINAACGPSDNVSDATGTDDGGTIPECEQPPNHETSWLYPDDFPWGGGSRIEFTSMTCEVVEATSPGLARLHCPDAGDETLERWTWGANELPGRLGCARLRTTTHCRSVSLGWRSTRPKDSFGG